MNDANDVGSTNGTSSELPTNGTSSELRPLRFEPFDEHKNVRIYLRNLPHWRQHNCTYFVTFRLVDSIPIAVHRQWEFEQSQWLKARGIRYDGQKGKWQAEFANLPQAERLKFDKHYHQQVQTCLDRGLGECWLKHEACIAALREQLFRADGERHHLGDFVIMPNHVHLLMTPIAGYEIERILKAIKGKAAIEINKCLERSGAVWQPESYDHIVRNLEQLLIYRKYMADNPMMSGLKLLDAALYRAEWMDDWITPQATT